MNNIKIITAAEVKINCPSINDEIETGMIDEGILLMQRAVMVPTCGQEWWDEIIQQRSGGTYSSANKVIVDNYLKYILSYAVWQNLVITLSYQLNSAGLRLKVSDHSAQAETADMMYYRDYTQNFIDNIRKEMYRYISLHKNDYPLYYNNKYHDHPSKNQYDWKIGSVGGFGTNRNYYYGTK